MEYLSIDLIQLKGSNDLETNFSKHIEYIEMLDDDLIVFPECSLVGYDFDVLKKYFFNDEEYEKVKLYNNNLINLIKKTDKTVIFGSVLKIKNKIFNVAFIVNKNFVKIYKKINLTEEEKDFFSPGRDLIVFNLKNKKIAPLICRDQSFMELFYKLKNKKVKIVIILSAHYYDAKDIFWKKYKNIAIPIVRSGDFNLDIIKVNYVGELNNKLSHGNSLFVNKGKLEILADELNEQVIKVKI